MQTLTGYESKINHLRVQIYNQRVCHSTSCWCQNPKSAPCPELLKNKARTRVVAVPEGNFRSNTFEMQNRIRSKYQNSAKMQNKY